MKGSLPVLLNYYTFVPGKWVGSTYTLSYISHYHIIRCIHSRREIYK